MPGEAEISFEEAVGGGAAAPSPAASASSISPSTGEISFAEASGPQQQPPAGPSFTEKLSQGYDLFKQMEQIKTGAGERSREKLLTDVFGEVEEPIEGEGFARHAGKAALRGARSIFVSPRKTAVEGIKGLASGTVMLGESMLAGFRGIASLVSFKLVKETVGQLPPSAATAPMSGAISQASQIEPLNEAVRGIESSMEQTAKMREIASQITKVNLAPEGKEGEAVEGLLMLIPEGIAAAGDTVYEKTGSAMAGAGSQGLLTLLTFKPGIAGKIVKASVEGVKSKQLFNTTFDALAISEPAAAKAIVDTVAKTEPKTATKLKVRLKTPEERAAYAERLGKKVVENEVKGKEITPEEAGLGLSKAVEETPKPQPKRPPLELIVDEDFGIFEIKSEAGEFLAQENRGFLQVKRSDVAAAHRRKGIAQEAMGMLVDEAAKRGLVLASDFSVSKSAQRVYEALAKKGFEVKENPNSPGVEGSKVSADPRVPVYEVTRKAVEPPPPPASTTGLAEAGSAMGKAIGENLRAGLWDALQKGKTKFAGLEDRVLAAALPEYRAGRIKTREQFDTFIKDFYGKKPASKTAPPTAAPEPKPAEVISPAVAEQIFVSGPTLDSLPGGKFIKGKIIAWWDEILRTIAPEALGPQAKTSAAVVANRIAESMNRDSANHGLATPRVEFWQRLTPKQVLEFMKDFEAGKTMTDPVLELAAENIRQRNREVYAQDQRNGIEYDPIDNYLYHIFQEGDAVSAHFERRYGKQWGDPKFTRDRIFDFYQEAIDAGFTPKFKNPEEIMLAREHASDIAQMRVQILTDLETYGLAQKAKKGGQPPKGDFIYRRSPNGQGYWVDATADVVLHNAFETRSLWNTQGILGDAFRGAMFLKNTTVPIKLALSLFHPLHVATIDNATGMVRASKSLLSGGINPVTWFKEMLEAAIYKDLGKETFASLPRIDMAGSGNRILRAYQGKIDPKTLGTADLLSLQYMAEGGMIPEMSVQYRVGAIEKFLTAIREVRAEYSSGPGGLGRAAKPTAKSAWYLPFAIIESLQRPMFQVWIPSLKIASYLKDVQTAVKNDPLLLTNRQHRIETFRKLAKSVDNRYGEMAYNTLFWNRTVKDLAVANTLSLGWNLGFIREYGGAVMDVGQSVTRKGSLSQKAKQGLLDRPLFVSYYTIQSLLYGGLLTWAFTGKTPEDLMDYIYPKNGNKTPSGEDERMTTMFYAREFAAISKHIEQEGAISGLSHLAANKASGVIGLVNQWRTGVNWMDQEIRDPNSPWHQQVRDTVKATMLDLEPISVKSARESEMTGKDIALSVAGFSKAPRYVSQTDTEAEISQVYRKYYAPKQTPYEAALISNDRRQLAKFFDEGKVDKYGELLDEMMTKYDLTAEEQGRLARNIMKRGVDYNPYLSMFERLTWQQQKRILDKMSPEERDVYLPRSNRQHLRYSYEEPTK